MGTKPLLHADTQETILVIDDEQSFCEVVAEILSNDGFDVHKAFSASQAEEILEHLDPELIILDIMMPDTDGLTLVRRLRSSMRFAITPIIVSSAKYLQEDKTAAIESGANLFLSKPFSAADLRTSIQTVMQNGS
ncbi:MAG: response regulator transcription factor [Anaerolineales bacterium]|nr:response regulator transcription factor [Anaerolineales bacterium]